MLELRKLLDNIDEYAVKLQQKKFTLDKEYFISLNENGYLDLYYCGSALLVPRYDNPSRKAIVRQELEDLNIKFPSNASVGNLIRRLSQTLRKNISK